MTGLALPPTFRNDINGLRAWAVVSVIFYHFGVPGFGGGFIGVDVFFVISGFLMTGIVVRGLERGNFTIFGFYLARAKRIVPALLCLCAVLILLGWFFLLPPDYKTLSSHAVYSLSFLSNIEYWREAGYFDVASHEKWLLHTWSLSVEWQFYLLLPIALWVTWRLKPGRAGQTAIIIAGIALSLTASVVTTKADPTQAFFLLHTRAWEMLAGGLVFMLAEGRALLPVTRRIVEAAGLLLIVLSIAFFNHDSVWPGYRAVIPVAGAMMVLYADRASVWTGNAFAGWLGDRSYSLYLWHWPIYVGLVYVEFRYNYLAIAGGIAATLLLGHFSYVLVENSSRQWLGRLRMPTATSMLALAASAVALPGVAVWAQHGVAGRFPPAAELAAAEAGNINPRKAICHSDRGVASPGCVYGKGDREMIVVGDSHADAMVSGFAQAAVAHNTKIVQWTYSGCPFVTGLRKTPADLANQSSDYRCSDFIAWADSQSLVQSPKIPFIIINRYASAALGRNEVRADGETPRVFFSKVSSVADAKFLNEFAHAITESACQLAKHRPVYMVRPIPEIGVDVPKTLSRRMTFGIEGDISVSMESYRRRNNWVWAAQDAARDRCGVKILDPLPYLCHDDKCFGSKGGHPLYYDDNHLSEFGNKQLAPMYQQAIMDRSAN
jgi:peptidoglycan/LPS O-acetylase OafA/YrhL